MRVDPDVRKFKPVSGDELEMIKYTLPEDARQYVQLDKKGFINKRQLNKYQGDSRNVANLKELVNSKSTIHVTLTDDPINVTDKMGKQNSVEMFYQGQMEDFKDPNFENKIGRASCRERVYVLV